MGLVLKLLNGQKVFLGDNISVEVSRHRGQVKLHFEGEKPFPFEIKRESMKEYRSRMGEEDESEIRSMQPKEVSENT